MICRNKQNYDLVNVILYLNYRLKEILKHYNLQAIIAGGFKENNDRAVRISQMGRADC